MKNLEKIMVFAIIALCGVIAGFCWGYSKCYTKHAQKEPTVVYVPKEKVIHDTMTDIQYKNVYKLKHDTTYLQCVDTLYQTDTVQVLVPIERKSFDTITADSIRVYGSISGYKANIDTLMVEGKKVENTVIVNRSEEKKWRFSYGFCLGIGWTKPF